MTAEGPKRIENSSMAAPDAGGVIRFSVRDSQAFVWALSKPIPMNERFCQTIKCYREASHGWEVRLTGLVCGFCIDGGCDSLGAL